MKLFRAIISLLRFDRNNWTALALCVFAAAVFWIFNALNKQYSTNLSLPFKVEYDENRYSSADVIPAKLTVNVSGNGWDLLRKSLDQNTRIAISMERPVGNHHIPGANLAPQVMSQLGALQLNFIVLDTLRLSIEEKTSRTLKLKADIHNITFRKNLGRTSPVTVSPDSIQLEGPSSFLAALPDTLVLEVPRRLIGADYRESLEVQLEKSEFIRRDPPVIEVQFEVGPIDQVSIKLKLALPVGIVSDQDSIACILSLPRRDKSRLTTDSTELMLELPAIGLQKGDSLKLLPKVTGLPPYVTLVQVDSVVVTRKK